MNDDLFGADSHLEAAYEDANGGTVELREDDDVYEEIDDEEFTEYDREVDYWKWSDRL